MNVNNDVELALFENQMQSLNCNCSQPFFTTLSDGAIQHCRFPVAQNPAPLSEKMMPIERERGAIVAPMVDYPYADL